jgi:hypothetical protein
MVGLRVFANVGIVTVPEPIDTAWKIHAAQVDWTGKVDTKASFALALESAVLAGAVGLSKTDDRFSNLQGFFPLLTFWTGVTLVMAAVVLAVVAVAPRTRDKNVPTEWPDNFIYFGHLQHWTSNDLEKALRSSDPLPMLSRQIVAMGKIACTKHTLVKWSMRAALPGAFLIVVAGIIA